MNKNTETKNADDTNTEIETVKTVELDNVTGGCARCGCGQPNAAAGQQQLAASWLRR